MRMNIKKINVTKIGCMSTRLSACYIDDDGNFWIFRERWLDVQGCDCPST